MTPYRFQNKRKFWKYARGGRWVDALIADSRFALRHFRRKPGQIVSKFAADGLRLSILGLLAGLPLSLLGLRMLLALLDYLSSVAMPPVAAMAAFGVVAVAAAATWIPARRAAEVHPAITLRRD